MTEHLIRRLDTWLAANRRECYGLLSPGVPKERLDKFEEKHALELPSSFRALYAWRNGQLPSCYAGFQGNRMFSPLEDIDETKEIFDGMIGTDFPDPRYWRRGWVPFLSNGGGSHLCIDLLAEDGGHPGQILEFWKGDPDRPVAHSSFTDWLAQLVESMESGSFEAE
jgi:cell wall assembly regulator SMI1